MAKVKFWVLEGVDKIVQGTYKMGKPNYVEAMDGTIYNISGANHGYTTREEAEAAFGATAPKAAPATKSFSTKSQAAPFNLTPGAYIGSDEVGKVEPLKQMVAVAVHVAAESFDRMNELGVDDSKKIPSKINSIGKTLTGFDDFQQFESGKVYENEEYGLTYCPVILSNYDYNLRKESKNANVILTELHNQANCSLYNYLLKKGVNIQSAVIDDYMDGRSLFDKYSKESGGDSIKDVIPVSFQVKADGKYKEIVGTASDICAYIDGLWQEHLNKKYGMELDYGNNIKAGCLKVSFDRISSVDPEMKDVKHTKTYEDWKVL